MIDYMKNNKVDIVDIYNMIDQDGQGSISKDELRRLFRTKVTCYFPNPLIDRNTSAVERIR